MRQIAAPELNFTAEFNTNGLSNVATGSLLDTQRAFFEVNVPAELGDAPVIGWELNLAQVSGVAAIRVRKNNLPSDSAVSAQTPFTGGSAIIVPPFLTNGAW